MLPVYSLYPTADVHNKATATLQMKISILSRSDGLIARQVENESFETASSSPEPVIAGCRSTGSVDRMRAARQGYISTKKLFFSIKNKCIYFAGHDKSITSQKKSECI